MNQRDLSPVRGSNSAGPQSASSEQRTFLLSDLAFKQKYDCIMMSTTPGEYVTLSCNQPIEDSICIFIHLHTRTIAPNGPFIETAIDEYDMDFWRRGTTEHIFRRLKSPHALSSNVERNTGYRTTFFFSLELYTRDILKISMERIALLYSTEFCTVSSSGSADNHRRGTFRSPMECQIRKKLPH